MIIVLFVLCVVPNVAYVSECRIFTTVWYLWCCLFCVLWPMSLSIEFSRQCGIYFVFVLCDVAYVSECRIFTTVWYLFCFCSV